MAEVTNSTASTSGQRRKLYKILRGSYSRREGDKQPFIDPETKRATQRKSRPFVHYSARTVANPRARDEIYMTDEEARAFGKHNLRELKVRDNGTTEDEDEKISFDELIERALPEDPAQRVAMLIEEGQVIRKNKQLAIWRQRVLEADVLPTSDIPTKRADVIDALKRVEV